MIYALTIFLSATLLFMVQLVMAKLILPWFGGTPSVWTTCMLVYQVLLLGGYTYAHLTNRFLEPRRQSRVHLVMLAGSLALLVWHWITWDGPLLPPDDWKPAAAEHPVPQILLLLLASIGLPFFVLSATSPLLQHWFSLRGSGDKAYRLYAVSNVGSLLGLLSYPFLIERVADLPSQSLMWGGLYAVFAVGCALCALGIARATPFPAEMAPARPGVAEANDAQAANARPGAATIGLWLLLTTCTSAMLLASTNALCQEVAVVPFLWVVPLALYLLSFVLCFDSPRWYRRRWFVLATGVGTSAVLITTHLGLRLSIPTHVVSHSLFLFLFCMTCHGELVRLKPAAGHLTLFYLVVALGGALGGVFVGLVAPAIFSDYWEFHGGLLAGWIGLAIVFMRDKTSFFHHGDRVYAWTLVFMLAWIVAGALALITGWLSVFDGWLRLAAHFAAAVLATTLVWLPFRRRAIWNSKLWPRVLVGAFIFVGECFMIQRVRNREFETIAAERNFYGVIRTQVHQPLEDPRSRLIQLTHGSINHGYQLVAPELRRLPAGYCGPNSGVGLAIANHPRRESERGQDGLRLGVLGLGVGAMAAWAQPRDTLRFYEINPGVVECAAGDNALFSYIADSAGTCEVVLGDGRLSLERELETGSPGRFDLLIMDAFSSDSVPVHLLTEEAFEIYRQHLRDADSMIAVNISNRFLDLRPLLFTVAERFGFSPILIANPGPYPLETASVWVLLCQGGEFADHPAIRDRKLEFTPRKPVLWTDRYSNLIGVLGTMRIKRHGNTGSGEVGE